MTQDRVKTVGLSNLQKRYASPTPKFFRKLGDSLLLVGSTITGYAVFEGSKTFAIISLIATVLGKVITNFASEE